MTFSDQANELTGKVVDSERAPATDCFVVVFGTDKQSWFFNSRRVVGVRPDGDGTYRIRNLPPGSYLVVASDDVEEGEWYVPSVLQRLAGSATSLTLGQYEKKALDIAVAATGIRH